MDARFALQPFADGRSLFDVLSELLMDDRFDRFTAVVAWAKNSGLRRIQPFMRSFHERGGTSTIVLGVDEGGATIDGLQGAIAQFDHAHVLFDSGSGTFHPKVYLFHGDESAAIVLGSNNLTAGGLYRNYEAAVVLGLDLSKESDTALHTVIVEFVRRLLDDLTSIELNHDSLEALRADARFKIEEEHRSSNGDSFGADKAAIAGSLFGRSRHPKKQDPERAARTKRGRNKHTQRLGTPIEGGSDAPVVARWTKKLTRSDCGRPNPGSKTTNALRFTKAGYKINQATWFRDDLYSDAAWLPDESRPGREQAIVRFEVEINGRALGTHALTLKYDARREAGQGNFTTDLKWGSLSPALRSEDLVGEWISIAKLSDGSYRLTVAPARDAAES